MPAVPVDDVRRNRPSRGRRRIRTILERCCRRRRRRGPDVFHRVGVAGHFCEAHALHVAAQSADHRESVSAAERLRPARSARDEAALRGAASEGPEPLDEAIAAIEALLRVGEIENRPSARRFGQIDLSGICADVFEFYEPLGRPKSISMVLEADAPGLIEGDRDLMREALSNLIDNAIKFTPEGGAVRVMAGMDSGGPVIRVCDNGAGVASAERERIFDRHFRAERANLLRGSGVGLSIATAIAHLHGLDLPVVDNNPDARFELSRPAPEE